MHDLLIVIRQECYKFFMKPRTYIGFIAIAAVVVLIQIAMYADGKSYWDFLTQSLSQSFDISGLDFNGNMVCFIILQSLIVQMPLMVALVAGDMISGEVQAGTIRSLLTKPISRLYIVAGKFLAAEIYTLLLILWLGLLAWILSLLLFGNGDVVVLKSYELVVIRAEDTAWRFMGAFLVAFLSLSVVNAFAFMLSTFAENSITPIIVTMSVIILFTIIGTFDVPLFDRIKPFLFTTHMIVWRNFFDHPLPVALIRNSSIVLAVHIAMFAGVGFLNFNKKDFLN